MNKTGKTYMAQFGWAMIAYGLVLSASVLILKSNPDPDAPWRIPVALAPLVPAIYGLITFVRFMGGMTNYNGLSNLRR